MVIKTKQFISKYLSCIPEPLFNKLQDLLLEGVRTTEISVTEFESIDSIFKERKRQNLLLKKCARINTRGKELEKAGLVNQAIRLYEKNIGYDCYPATFSFDRLMILYHKAKDYENEKRVILRALDVFNSPSLISKYQNRLAKIEQKQPIFARK